MIPGPDDAPAPGAPAAPAPPVITEAPAQPVDNRTAVEKATDAARERLRDTGTSLPGEEPAKKPAAPAAPRARNEKGEFVDLPRRRTAPPIPQDVIDDNLDPTPRTDVDPAKGPDDDEPDAGLDDGEPKPGEEGAEEGAEEDRGTEGQDDEFEVVEIPGRRAGETVKMQFAKDEVPEIRRLVNGYMRSEQLQEERAEFVERAQRIEDMEEEIELDPGSAVRRILGNDADALEQLALTILADPQMWQRVGERVLKWDDPREYELEAAKLQVAASERRDEMRTVREERAVVSRNLQQVQASVASLIPPEMGEEQQSIFYRDALRDLKEYADRGRLLTLDPRDIPLILATSGRLKAHGINAVEAAERIQEALSGTRRAAATPGKKQPARVGAPAPGKPATPPPAKRGKEFAEGAQRRRVAAAAPQGAGSPSTVVTPPPNQTIEERIAWARQQSNKGRALTR